VACRGEPTWDGFVEGLLLRFGPSAYDNVDGELAKIRQTSTVSEYQSRFERLYNRTRGWSEKQLVGTFIEGLQSEIRREVKAQRPRTITAAFSNARVQEERLSEEKHKTTKVVSRMSGGSTGAPNLPRKPYATRLTQEELKQRTAKGLCWHCDEKWHRGHQCKQGKLLMIEPVEVPMHSDINGGESDSDNEESETTDDLLAVTVHALAGYSNPQTMRVSGYIKRQPVTVLIDTGSTNNFLDEDVAKRLSLPVETCDKFEVKLADGRTLTCESKCSRIKLLVQNQELRADFYLLPLGDYEVVLGIEWLQTLGDVLWNFSKLTMKFMINGQNVTFRGKRGGNVTTVSSNQMERILKKERQVYLLQLKHEEAEVNEQEKPEIESLLEEFGDIFSEPKTLPPK
jgi:hypothetical protein